MELQTLIMAKEKSLLTSDVRNSPQKLQSLLTIDFMEVGSSGKIYYLDDIIKQLPFPDYKFTNIQNIKFCQLSDTLVQLIYQIGIQSQENSASVFSCRTSLWRKENEKWKLFYHQGTNLAL